MGRWRQLQKIWKYNFSAIQRISFSDFVMIQWTHWIQWISFGPWIYYYRKHLTICDAKCWTHRRQIWGKKSSVSTKMHTTCLRGREIVGWARVWGGAERISELWINLFNLIKKTATRIGISYEESWLWILVLIWSNSLQLQLSRFHPTHTRDIWWAMQKYTLNWKVPWVFPTWRCIL